MMTLGSLHLWVRPCGVARTLLGGRDTLEPLLLESPFSCSQLQLLTFSHAPCTLADSSLPPPSSSPTQHLTALVRWQDEQEKKMCMDTRPQTPPHRSLSLAWLACTHIQRSTMNRRRGEVKGRWHGLGQGDGQEQKV